MDLSPPAILTLRSESYFALTTNSVQLGSRVEMGADLGVADISGHFALRRADRLRAALHVHDRPRHRADGARVRRDAAAASASSCTSKGPAPWRAEGSAEVEILWWTVPIDVGPFTWGDDDNPPPAPADPRQLVHDALHHNPGAWQALMPPDADRVVRLKPAAAERDRGDGAPDGAVRRAPARGPARDRHRRASAPTRCRRASGGCTSACRWSTATPAGALSEVTDLFSAGQLPRSHRRREALAARASSRCRPAHASGRRARRPTSTRSRQAELRYETFVCDDDDDARHAQPARTIDVLFASSTATALAAGAAGRSELRAPPRYATDPDPIVLADPGEVQPVSKATRRAGRRRRRADLHARRRAPLAADAQLARLGVA